MSWEVQTLTSRTSFFNRRLSGNLLRRFWPLWAGYLALLLLSFSFQLPQDLERISRYTYPADPHLTVLANAVTQAQLAPIVAILAAMALFGYLYSDRLCGMMHALPLRRETLFGTAALTGLLPLLLCQVLATLIAALGCLGYELNFVWLLEWLGISALGLVAFYGFAVFCAMLTGNILVLPAVYLVLGLCAVAAEGCVRGLLGLLVYGAGGYDLALLPLSPLAAVYEHLSAVQVDGMPTLRGLGVLAVYAAAGLALLFAALPLYKRRHVECAGDAVAVPVLKPVFRVCMCFGTAFVFAVAMLELLPRPGSAALLAALAALLLVLGAFLGWCAAEMLIQRSFKISLRRPILPLVAGALLLLFVAGIRLDLTGFERRVPEAGQVESVEVYGVEFKEQANIDAALALHRALVDNRARHEALRDGVNLEICYRLRDGSRLLRSYCLPYDAETPDPELLAAAALLDSREAMQARVSTRLPVEPRYIVYAQLSRQTFTDEGRYTDEYRTLNLSAQQAAALYCEGILADAAEGHIAYGPFSELQPGAPSPSGYYLDLILASDADQAERDRYGAMYEDYNYFAIYEDSKHTLKWIEENLGF